MGGYFMVANFFSLISLEKSCDYVEEVNLQSNLERQSIVGKIDDHGYYIRES